MEIILFISNIGSSSDDRSENQFSKRQTDDEDAGLKALLKDYKLTDLYDKFKKMGVTAEIFWDVEEEDLLEYDFSKFERKRIIKVIYEKQNTTRQGKNNLMFTRGRVNFHCGE